MSKDVLEELRGKVQLGPAPIQTAEDARMAYLREEIDYEQLKAILAWHGASVEPTSLVAHPNSFDRVDDAFHRHLPDVAEARRDKLEDHLARVDAKAKAREAADEAAPKPKDVNVESSVKAVVDPNRASHEAYRDVLEKEIPKIEKAKEARAEKEEKELDRKNEAASRAESATKAATRATPAGVSEETKKETSTPSRSTSK